MRKYMLVLLADVVAVLVFCAFGRRSHEEAVLAGLARTAWPFLAGMLVGWAVLLYRRVDPVRVWPAGCAVWLSAVVLGMVLRAVSGQGVAPSFVAVAATVLAVFLLGWRVLAGWAGQRWAAQRQ